MRQDGVSATQHLRSSVRCAECRDAPRQLPAQISAVSRVTQRGCQNQRSSPTGLRMWSGRHKRTGWREMANDSGWGKAWGGRKVSKVTVLSLGETGNVGDLSALRTSHVAQARKGRSFSRAGVREQGKGFGGGRVSMWHRASFFATGHDKHKNKQNKNHKPRKQTTKQRGREAVNP